jgi:hypothetical protein
MHDHKLRELIGTRVQLCHEMIRRLDYEKALAAVGVTEADVHSLDVRDGKLVGIHLTRPMYQTKQRGVASNYRRFTPALYYAPPRAEAKGAR